MGHAPDLFWSSTFAEISLLIESKQRAKTEKLEIARWKVWAYLQSKSKQKIRMESILPLPTDKKEVIKRMTEAEKEASRKEFELLNKLRKEGKLVKIGHFK